MSKVDEKIAAENARWRFSGDVVDHFDEHVERSVPFYHEGHQLIVRLADFFLGDRAQCVDLGCSTGTLVHALATSRNGMGDTFIGIDAEPEMVARANERCREFENVSFLTAELDDLPTQSSDLISAYYTMQFVRPKRRQDVFDKIYRNLNWGGAFIMFEKVRAPDARFQDISTSLYTDYKLAEGYSGDEIIAKMRSLKGVLEPFSTEGNLGLLRRAGFVDITTIFKYVSFEGFLAIK